VKIDQKLDISLAVREYEPKPRLAISRGRAYIAPLCDFDPLPGCGYYRRRGLNTGADARGVGE
jgi:hypothetical protein